MKQRLALALSAMMLAVTTTVRGDPISGALRIGSDITHTGSGTASTLEETLTDVWKWAGGSSSLGTGATATALSTMYVTVSNNVPAGSTNTLDLYDSLYDSFGAKFKPAKIKGFVFCPSNTLSVLTNGYQSMLVRPAPANGWGTWMSTTTSAVRVFSGGVFALFAPTTNAYAVTDATGDLLDIINESTNACGFRLYLFGE